MERRVSRVESEIVQFGKGPMEEDIHAVESGKRYS